MNLRDAWAAGREAVRGAGDGSALRQRKIKAQEIANTVWVSATFGQLDEKLFAALAREAALRVRESNAQDIANTALAFATHGQLDEKVFAALARETALRVREFTAQGIANTAGAFATLGQLVEKLFACSKHRKSPTQFKPSLRLGSRTKSCSRRWRGKQRCV